MSTYALHNKLENKSMSNIIVLIILLLLNLT